MDSLSSPRIPYATKRSPLPTKYSGCPCQLQANYCEQLAMEHPFFVWEDGVPSFSPGRTEAPSTSDAVFRSVLPPLHLITSSSPSRFTATHCTERTRPR